MDCQDLQGAGPGLPECRMFLAVPTFYPLRLVPAFGSQTLIYTEKISWSCDLYEANFFSDCLEPVSCGTLRLIGVVHLFRFAELSTVAFTPYRPSYINLQTNSRLPHVVPLRVSNAASRVFGDRVAFPHAF